MRRLLILAFLLASAAPLMGCVVEPVRPAGCAWVPGHYVGWRWVPGHCVR